MKYKCTNCDKLYSVKQKLMNKRFRCKVCATVNTISMPETKTKNHDSVAAYNQFLHELSVWEKKALPIGTDS